MSFIAFYIDLNVEGTAQPQVILLLFYNEEVQINLAQPSQSHKFQIPRAWL